MVAHGQFQSDKYPIDDTGKAAYRLKNTLSLNKLMWCRALGLYRLYTNGKNSRLNDLVKRALDKAVQCNKLIVLTASRWMS